MERSKRILLTAAAFGALGAAVAYYRYKLLERFEVLDDPTHDEDVEAVPGDPYQPRTLRGYGEAKRTTGGYADIRQEDLDG